MALTPGAPAQGRQPRRGDPRVRRATRRRSRPTVPPTRRATSWAASRRPRSRVHSRRWRARMTRSRRSSPRCSTSARATSRCRVRPEPARPTWRRGWSANWCRSIGGGSASSPSRTASSRTCSTRSCSAGSTSDSSRRHRRPSRAPAYYAGSPFTELRADAHAAFAAEHRDHGYVIGGTSWDFTNLKRVDRDQLDLLVDRGGGPVLAREHDRGGRRGAAPSAARRPAAASAGEPGHPPGAGRRLRARPHRQRARRAAARARVLPRRESPDGCRGHGARVASRVRGRVALAREHPGSLARRHRAGAASDRRRPSRQFDVVRGGGGAGRRTREAAPRRALDRARS